MDYIIIALITIILVTFLIKYFKNKNKKDNKNNKDNKDNNMTYNFMKRPAEGGGGNVEKPAIVSADEKPYIDTMKWLSVNELADVSIDLYFCNINFENGTFIMYKDYTNLKYPRTFYFNKDKETGYYKFYFDKDHTRLFALSEKYTTGVYLTGFGHLKFYV